MALDLAAIRARLAAQIAWTPPLYKDTPMTDVDALIGEVERLEAENRYLREWLRGECTITDADIDAAIARDTAQGEVPDEH